MTEKLYNHDVVFKNQKEKTKAKAYNRNIGDRVRRCYFEKQWTIPRIMYIFDLDERIVKFILSQE